MAGSLPDSVAQSCRDLAAPKAMRHQDPRRSWRRNVASAIDSPGNKVSMKADLREPQLWFRANQQYGRVGLTTGTAMDWTASRAQGNASPSRRSYPRATILCDSLAQWS